MNNRTLNIIEATYIIICMVIIVVLLIQRNQVSSELNKTMYYYDYVKNNYEELSKQYVSLTKEFNTLTLRHRMMSDEYQKTSLMYETLEKSFSSLETNYNSITSEHKNLALEHNNLVLDLNEYQNEIKKSMEWFKLNSRIDDLEFSDSLKNELKKGLFCDGSVCIVKTAYIDLVNEINLKLGYAYDSDTTGKKDKLLDLETFVKTKKGDCEDFAQLYSAELRYLIDYVTIDLKKQIRFEAFEQVSDTTVKYSVYQDWYYQGASRFLVGGDYKYPYVACGNLFDPVARVVKGHCVVMLSNINIKSEKDIFNLTDSVLIEPQTGSFVGYLNKSYASENNKYSIYLIGANKEAKSNIFEFISDSDIYFNESIYTGKDPAKSNWISYSYYLDKLEKYKIDNNSSVSGN
ncbi:MAG: hypothetical protein V1824_03070 [archaeon]